MKISMRGSLVAIGLLAGLWSAGAAEYWVTPGGTGDYTQANPGPPPWRAAAKATQPGDVIHLAAGTYSYKTGDFKPEPLTIKPGVIVIGATDNPADTVIERVKQAGDSNHRALYLGRNATLRNLTVRGRHQGDLIAYNECGTNFSEGGSALQPQTGSAADCWAVNCTIFGNKGGSCQAFASHVTNSIVWAAVSPNRENVI